MNPEILSQIKKVIIKNKMVERDIKLSLSEKSLLKNVSNKLRVENKIDNMSFEEFVVVCKHLRMSAIMTICTDYNTRVVDLLIFNQIVSLKDILISMLEDQIENTTDKLSYIINLNNIRIREVILFEEFIEWCDKLNASIVIY